MKKQKLLILTGTVAVCLVGLWFLFFLPHGFHKPDIAPPAGSQHVRFFERGGWQSFQYYYRLDNEPHICIDFAKQLMQNHGFGNEISTEPFSSIPENSSYPEWFTPNDIENGIMILGDGFADAYIDKDAGRLYFKIWH